MNSTGYEKAKEVANGLKQEVLEKEEKQEVEKQVAITQLAELSSNHELAQMYQDNALVGSENLAGELPLLKVHAVGRSSSNELADGQEPKDGAFFYKPTKEQFDSVTCHVLTISRGYRAEGLNEDKDGKKQSVFNQILGGVIVEGKDYKPFLMYFTGLKLQNLWTFGKEISKYTHMKPIAIPMFALTVKLTTHKVTNTYGKSWLVDFEVVKTEGGTPQLVLDPGEFQFLKDTVESLDDTIASLIDSKTAKGIDATPGEVVDTVLADERVYAKDMPF